MTINKFIAAFCFLMAIFVFRAYAQPQPDLTCVSVISANSVQVSWEIPAGSFDGFRLYHGPVGGSFTSDDYPPGESSAIISAPNVSTIKYEFFLVTYTISPATISVESNHLETILLSVFGEGTGIARLEWNRQSAQDQNYKVMRSEDGISFSLITTTSSLIFNDTIENYCDPTMLYYRIEAGSCNAYSTIAGANFEDLTPPYDPIFKVVTVNNGFAELSWEPSPSDDVAGYIIERNSPLGWFEYRTTGNVTSFIDNFSADPDYQGPCDNVVSYVVRAQDQCGLGSAGDYMNYHQNIMITGNTSSFCDRKATLQWNQYENMQPPVTHYKVERSAGGLPFVDIQDVASTSITTYEFTDPELLEPGAEVKYRITAVNADNSLLSHSCELVLVPQPAQVTDFEITNVTVSDNTFITISVSALPEQVPQKLAIYRSTGNESLLVATVPWDASGVLTFEDMDVSVGTKSYNYSVAALDACDFEIIESQVFNSMLLSIAVSDEVNVTLNWTDHIGWGDELVSYLIYKYNDGVLVAGYPETVSSALTAYNEVDNDNSSLQTTYYVEAVREDGTISRSNEVLLPRSAELDIPTAFKPSGLNSIFRPLVRNIDNNKYSLIIYNRWGQQVFQTNDPLQGWNGRYNGEIQQGLYAYVISFTDQAGTAGYRRGTIMLFD